MATKRRKPRTEASKLATQRRKETRKAAQVAAERRNAAARSTGAVPPSEVLWGDVKRRAAAARDRRRQDRMASAWRKLVPEPKGQGPRG